MRINYNPQGTLVSNESLTVTGINVDLSLSHDLFLSTDFIIKNGTTDLVYNQDYVITDRYERLKEECGLTCYKHLRIINSELLNITLIVTYRAVGDFVKSDEVVFTDNGDDRYCQRTNNLSDIANKQIAMTNIADSFGGDSSSLENDNTIIPVKYNTTWCNATLLRIWNYIKTKIENVLGLSDTQYNGKLSKKLTLTKNDTTVEFDGSDNQSIDLTTAIQPLTIKVNNSTVATFDGSEAKTANITTPTQINGYLQANTSASFTLPARSVFFGVVVQNNGGSFSASNYTLLYYNDVAWSSGTKSISNGQTITIANLSSSSKTITLLGNGGGEVKYILI